MGHHLNHGGDLVDAHAVAQPDQRYCASSRWDTRASGLSGAYSAAATVVTAAKLGSHWLAFVLSSIGLAWRIVRLPVGLPCLRFEGRLPGHCHTGFSEILRNLIQNSKELGQSWACRSRTWCARVAGAPHVLSDLPGPGLVPSQRATLVVLRNLVNSSHGRAIQARAGRRTRRRTAGRQPDALQGAGLYHRRRLRRAGRRDIRQLHAQVTPETSTSRPAS